MPRTIEIDEIRTLTEESFEEITTDEFDNLAVVIDAEIKKCAKRGERVAYVHVQDKPQAHTVTKILDDYEAFSPSFHCPSTTTAIPTEQVPYFKFSW